MTSEEQCLLKIITGSAKVRTLGQEALALAKKGQDATQHMTDITHQLIIMHQLQTQLIQLDLSNEDYRPSLLAVHAQDHFMQSQLWVDMIKELIEQIQQLTIMKQQLNALVKKG